MNVFSEKLTSEERDWGVDQYPIIDNLINQGLWSYSRNALEKDFNGWKYISWAVANKGLYAVILISSVILGVFTLFAPPLILIIIQTMSMGKYSNYKEILLKHKSGNLVKVNENSTVSTNEINSKKNTQSSGVEELSKLFDLLKAGAITQDEFDEQKKKLLK